MYLTFINRPIYSVIVIVFITIFAITLSVTIDTQTLVESAYSLPLILWRALTYGFIFIRAHKNQYAGLGLLFIINEGLVCVYTFGGAPW